MLSKLKIIHHVSVCVILIHETCIFAVPPSPPFPQITGCDSGPSNCTRAVERQDYLTCFVQGIRPPVHLDFKYIGDGPSPITFSDLVPYESLNDPVYYISIRENFEIVVEESINISVECKASGPNVDKFKSKARITLSYQFIDTGKA